MIPLVLWGLFAVCLVLTAVLASLAFRRADDAHARIDEVEEDARIERIETRRSIGSDRQLAQDVAILDAFRWIEAGEGSVSEFMVEFAIVAEWTRPDYRDERVPEPHRQHRGFVPW